MKIKVLIEVPNWGTKPEHFHAFNRFTIGRNGEPEESPRNNYSKYYEAEIDIPWYPPEPLPIAQVYAKEIK